MSRKIHDFGSPGQGWGTQGTGPNGLAREGNMISWHPGSGSLVSGSRQPGARYGENLVIGTENVDFWYRSAGTVVTGSEIDDFGYPKYRDLGAFGIPKM